MKNTNTPVSKEIHGKPTKTTLFSTISSILAVPFVLMLLVFTHSASNPEHSVMIIYNAYGEWLLEIIVFTVTGAIVIIGAVMNVRNLKEMKN